MSPVRAAKKPSLPAQQSTYKVEDPELGDLRMVSQVFSLVSTIPGQANSNSSLCIFEKFGRNVQKLGEGDLQKAQKGIGRVKARELGT